MRKTESGGFSKTLELAVEDKNTMAAAVDEFRKIVWDGLVAEAKSQDCSSYWPLLLEAADRAKNNGDVSHGEALELMGRACSLSLRNDDPEVLVATIHFQTGRSASLHDFSDEGLNLFEAVVPTVSDPALRSRLADILYLRRANWRIGRKASEAYLALAEAIAAKGGIVRVDMYCRRALDLAAKLGRRNKFFADVVMRVEDLVRRFAASDSPRLATLLLDVLIAHRKGCSPEFISLVERWAKEAVESKEWLWACRCCSILAKLRSLTGDIAGRNAAAAEHARVFELQAQDAASKQPPNFLVAADCLQRSIAVLRNVPGTREQRMALARQLRNWQPRAVQQLGKVSTKLDVSELVRAARRAVSKKNFRDAAIGLATMLRPTPVGKLEQDTKDAIQQSPLQHLLSTAILDSQGRVVALRSPLPLGDGERAKVALEADMFRTAKFYQGYDTHAIDAARLQIAFEHPICFADVFDLAASSPLVPRDRPIVFSQGLLLGFLGDYAGAAHLLIPQLENALRVLLNRIGVVTTRQQQDQTQEEPDLNSLLHMPELARLLDEDTIFDLRGLLIERFGSNLRNRLLHGLVSDNQLHSSEAAYLWWSVLRLCCVPLLKELETEDAPTEEGPQSRTD